MKFVKGFTFRLAPSENQSFSGAESKESLRLLKESTNCDTIMLAAMAFQDTPFSEIIDYKGEHFPTDEELTEIINYAGSLGLRVFLKPMVNCRNGVWRAHINFFDREVPCEPKWSHWFSNYENYILHMAKIAQNTGCEMLSVGCELVQTERKEQYWRKLICEVRKIYSGLITYNTDKYQESEILWWDAVDVISSSGYYPINEWSENLDRIEAVVKKFNKPFFFAECGCPCRTGSSNVPNDWAFEGALNIFEQEKYYEKMFEECNKKAWIEGYCCWDWISSYTDIPVMNDGYSVYKKPACKVIRSFYGQ